MRSIGGKYHIGSFLRFGDNPQKTIRAPPTCTEAWRFIPETAASGAPLRGYNLQTPTVGLESSPAGPRIMRVQLAEV
jgi:hypothetical protein